MPMSSKACVFALVLALLPLLASCRPDGPTGVEARAFRPAALAPGAIDTTRVPRAVVGDLEALLGLGRSHPPRAEAGAAPEVSGSAAFTPLETTVVLYYLVEWLHQNGYLDATAALLAVARVIEAYAALAVGEEERAVTAFTAFAVTVGALVSNGSLPAGAGQALI